MPELIAEKVITYGIPAVCVLIGGVLQSFWSRRNTAESSLAEREKDIFRRLHELWEQEIERHEICQDEVRTLNDRVNKLLMDLATCGIKVGDK